jgi:hypothetical protein
MRAGNRFAHQENDMIRRLLDEFKPTPKNDTYTLMLSIALMAMLAACGLFYHDLKQYPF